MNDKRSILIPLLVILGAAFSAVVFLLPSVTAAQPEKDVRAEIEKTDRILDLARKVVVELDAVQADEAIEGAVKLQREAHDALDLGEPQRAMRLTHEARRRAQRAMGSEAPDPDNFRTVERELRKTDRMLEGTDARMRRSGAPHFRRRLDDLRHRQERAWDFHRSRRLRPAMRATLGIRDELEGFRRRGGEGPTRHFRQGDRLEFQAARMEKALERLRSMVNGDNPRTQEQLELAEAAHQAALGALQDGDVRRAEIHLHEGRFALGEALQGVADDLRERDFSNLIADARNRLEAVTQAAGDQPDPEIGRRLKAAESALTKAQRSYDDNQRRRALLHTHRALNILDWVESEITP